MNVTGILRRILSFNKYNKTEINPYILSDHNTKKLELNKKRNSKKYSNPCGLKNTLLHN
jgi:hypothetical protein